MFATKVESKPLNFEGSPYPLSIQPIPADGRILPELECRLIHQETGLRVPGQFTEAEAKLIQTVTQNWDWQTDKNNLPACAARLLQYLEQLCERTSENEEVAS